MVEEDSSSTGREAERQVLDEVMVVCVDDQNRGRAITRERVRNRHEIVNTLYLHYQPVCTRRCPDKTTQRIIDQEIHESSSLSSLSQFSKRCQTDGVLPSYLFL